MTVPTAGWIYLDSTILIGAVITGVNHSRAAQAFCRALAEQGRIVAFSSLALLEFGHIVRSLGHPRERRRLPIDVAREYGLDRWDSDETVRLRWMTDAVANLNALLEEFAIVYEIPVLPDYWDDAVAMMVRYDLRSFDALHLVTALRNDIEHIASADRHFSIIDGITVHIVRDEHSM